MRFVHLVAALSALLVSIDAPRPAVGCGGASVAELAALAPMSHTLATMQTPGGDWAAWGQELREELRFLYPFVKSDKKLGVLWDFAHEAKTSVPAPSTQAFEAALRAGDRKLARTEANAILEAILELPPVLAAEHGLVLWDAVEFLELEPKLGKTKDDVVADYFSGKPVEKTKLPPILKQGLDVRAATPAARPKPLPKLAHNHPRAGSVEYWAMLADFRAKVPDGYRDAIQKQVKKATWQALEKNADSWLKAHAKHPIADLVTLWKVRIRYLSGDDTGAWQILFDMYPRRKVRVLSEMRYLLLQDRLPTSTQLDALTDGQLIAGLARNSTIDATRFDRWWTVSERDKKAAWAINLQERLLLWAATGARTNALPQQFPDKADNPSQLWGKLRLAALIEARRWQSAREQIDSLKPDPEQARLAAQYFLARKRPDLAASVPKLDEDSRVYVVSVLVDDRALATLTRSKSKSVARMARFEQAVRLAARGKWRAGAKLIEKDEPAKAKRWNKIAVLSEGGDAKLLAYARALRDAHGELLYPADRGFYRGVSYRFDSLPPKASERPAIERAFTRTSERWLALEALTRWLSRHSTEARARSVLDESDAVFNLLVNWGGSDKLFWGAYAKKSATVAELRRLGKSIRAARP
jgi:hypothetical protein